MRVLRSLTFMLLLAAGICLAASGCATRGPASSGQMTSLAMQALPQDAGRVIHLGPGEWYPNVKGFNDVRSNPFSPVSRQTGVWVLTDQALYFEQWSAAEKAYEVVKRIGLKEIRSLGMDKEGASRRVVLRRPDLSYDSLALTQAGGLLGDRSETETLHQHLEKLLNASASEPR